MRFLILGVHSTTQFVLVSLGPFFWYSCTHQKSCLKASCSMLSCSIVCIYVWNSFVYTVLFLTTQIINIGILFFGFLAIRPLLMRVLHFSIISIWSSPSASIIISLVVLVTHLMLTPSVLGFILVLIVSLISSSDFLLSLLSIKTTLGVTSLFSSPWL